MPLTEGRSKTGRDLPVGSVRRSQRQRGLANKEGRQRPFTSSISSPSWKSIGTADLPVNRLELKRTWRESVQKQAHLKNVSLTLLPCRSPTVQDDAPPVVRQPLLLGSWGFSTLSTSSTTSGDRLPDGLFATLGGGVFAAPVTPAFFDLFVESSEDGDVLQKLTS